MTRPTIVKLLDAGKIPFEKPGSHRKVRLEDVLEYKEARKAEQYEALASMAASEDENPETVNERMRRTRKEAARYHPRQSPEDILNSLDSIYGMDSAAGLIGTLLEPGTGNER